MVNYKSMVKQVKEWVERRIGKTLFRDDGRSVEEFLLHLERGQKLFIRRDSNDFSAPIIMDGGKLYCRLYRWSDWGVLSEEELEDLIESKRLDVVVYPHDILSDDDV